MLWNALSYCMILTLYKMHLLWNLMTVRSLFGWTYSLYVKRHKLGILIYYFDFKTPKISRSKQALDPFEVFSKAYVGLWKILLINLSNFSFFHVVILCFTSFRRWQLDVSQVLFLSWQRCGQINLYVFQLFQWVHVTK